jgi:diguanylate cyclase (GGDEF)-like protein
VQQGSLPDPELVHPAGRRSPGVPPACDTTQAALLARLERLTEQLEQKSRLLREHEAQLARSRALFERASATAKVGVWECDLACADTLRWTDAVYDLFELPRQSPIDRAQTVAMYSPESRAEMQAARRRAIAECSGFTLDAKITTARGNERWMRLTAAVESENGVAVRIFGMKQDITAERALWDKTRYLAETDVLTGLANRSLFQTILTELDASETAGIAAGPLLLVDLDGFKQVNDVFGHALGDECLKQVAERLQRLCRETRLVARIGGDEFAILMQGDATLPQAEALAERLLAELHLPVVWREHSFQLGASIGIALPPGPGSRCSSELFSHADIALYAAKACGKHTFRVFDDRMKREGDERFATIRGIAKALAKDELELHYQPKLRLADGSLSGFEALLRRRMPDGRIVSAGAFQAAFADPELSARLGAWVVEEALRQAGRWHRAGFEFGSIAVNLSASQLNDHRFADALIARLAEEGLLPGMIEVEVTEGVFLDNEAGTVKHVLERLKDSGMRVALDDFGTGYASLVHLRSYPVDIIKIDRSFVQGFLSSPQDRAILETMLRLGASLGLDIVAEGIETQAQLDGLKALGCALGQGFLFSQALPASQAIDWLTPRRA